MCTTYRLLPILTIGGGNKKPWFFYNNYQMVEHICVSTKGIPGDMIWGQCSGICSFTLCPVVHWIYSKDLYSKQLQLSNIQNFWANSFFYIYIPHHNVYHLWSRGDSCRSLFICTMYSSSLDQLQHKNAAVSGILVTVHYFQAMTFCCPPLSYKCEVIFARILLNEMYIFALPPLNIIIARI